MWVEATVCISLTLLPSAGTLAVDSYFSEVNSNWYKELRKPYWIAPKTFFQITWMSVFTGMGLASYLVWKHPDETKMPLLIYSAQLVLTWAWTPLFFSLRSPLAGLLDLAVLVPTVDICTYKFFQIDFYAGCLMAPYPLWLVYISYLNFQLYILNKDRKPDEGD